MVSHTSFGTRRAPRLHTIAIEHIFDELNAQGDRTSLRACALACTEWLPRCRYHLFRTLYVKNIQQFGALCDLLKASPVLRSLVEEVTVFFSRPSGTYQAIHDVAIVVLLRHLPCLRSWAFVAHDLDMPQTFRSTTLTYLRQYSYVRVLSLEHLTLRDLAEAARILINLPTIQSLRCGPDIKISADRSIPVPIKNRLLVRPRLSKLQVCRRYHWFHIDCE